LALAGMVTPCTTVASRVLRRQHTTEEVKRSTSSRAPGMSEVSLQIA